MPPFVKTILYGIGVFSLFTIFAVVLKLISGFEPQDGAYFGLVTNRDLLLGLAVAVVVTLNHMRRMKIK